MPTEGGVKVPRREAVDSDDQGRVLDVPLDQGDDEEYEAGVHMTIPVDE
jgi:hypothetical protein